MNAENPVYLLYTNRRVTDTKTGKRKDYPVFANQAFTLKTFFIRQRKMKMSRKKNRRQILILISENGR